MKNNFLNVMSLVLFVFVFGACTGASDMRKQLLRETEELNSKCPMSIGIACNLTSTDYDVDANRLAMSYEFNPDIVSLDIISDNRDLFVNMLKIVYAGDNMADFISLIEEAGCSLGVNITVPGSDDAVELMLTADDIKEIANSDIDEHQRATMYLDFLVLTTGKRIPFSIDEATTLTSMELSDSALVYGYVIDESLVPLDMLRDNAKEMKQSIATAFNDPSMSIALRSLSTLGKGMVYRYTDSQGEEFVEISFSPSEIGIY